MAKSRSTLLVVIGVAVFILGTALALVAINSGDEAPKVTTTQAAPKPGEVTPPTGAVAAAFEIPAGKQALAISVGYVQGVAGYVKPGDKVNVFATIKGASQPPNSNLKPPLAKLVLDGVPVLAVSAPAPGVAAPSTTFLLAVSPPEAEQMVYLQTFESVYLSLARSDQPAIDSPGRSASNPL